MKLIIITLLFCCSLVAAAQPASPDQKIFISGGAFDARFVTYVAELTGKDRPRVCFLPTASADNPYAINWFYELCAGLNVEPHVLRVWINSPNQPQSWEEIISSMDAIIVGGGNTLNMLAIWKAQGIDKALENALAKGIVLSGGSAGSLCWFNGGTTDSRPKELTIVEGLGFLNYSHCPHYHSEASRQPLYHQNILDEKLDAGYACDDRAGILFVNGQFREAVSMDEKNNNYYVYKKDGKIIEEKLESRILQ